MAEQLSVGGRAATRDDVVVLRGTLDRDVPAPGRGRAARPPPSGWPGWPTTSDELPGSGIIYCLTVAATEQVADHLRGQRVPGGGLLRSDRAEPDRLEAEDDLLANRVKALVATSALGMGFDKPDLGFVVHLGAPPSPIAYYQQVGRAGRGSGPRRRWCCCRAERTREVWNYFGSLGLPARATRCVQTLEVLAARDEPMSTPALEPRVDARVALASR